MQFHTFGADFRGDCQLCSAGGHRLGQVQERGERVEQEMEPISLDLYDWSRSYLDHVHW